MMAVWVEGGRICGPDRLRADGVDSRWASLSSQVIIGCMDCLEGRSVCRTSGGVWVCGLYGR